MTTSFTMYANTLANDLALIIFWIQQKFFIGRNMKNLINSNFLLCTGLVMRGIRKCGHTKRISHIKCSNSATGDSSFRTLHLLTYFCVTLTSMFGQQRVLQYQ